MTQQLQKEISDRMKELIDEVFKGLTKEEKEKFILCQDGIYYDVYSQSWQITFILQNRNDLDNVKYYGSYSL
jgi:hypothetical protein